MEGAGHQRRVSDCPKSVPIAGSFESVEETSQVAPSTSTNDSVTEITGEGRAIQSLTDLCTLSKKITDTEILRALNCVYFDFSGNSNVGVNDLFKRMFSDSEIALNYLMTESKFRYVTTWPIFRQETVTQCVAITSPRTIIWWVIKWWVTEQATERACALLVKWKLLSGVPVFHVLVHRPW